jgi:hypothetical protein
MADIPSGLSTAYWRSWSLRNGLSVNESLDNGEEWIGSWDGVGLYEQYVSKFLSISLGTNADEEE